ncbi:hypothetical protein ACVIGV_007117 [Rhizobium leguminosarum]
MEGSGILFERIERIPGTCDRLTQDRVADAALVHGRLDGPADRFRLHQSSAIHGTQESPDRPEQQKDPERASNDCCEDIDSECPDVTGLPFVEIGNQRDEQRNDSRCPHGWTGWQKLPRCMLDIKMVVEF